MRMPSHCPMGRPELTNVSTLQWGDRVFLMVTDAEGDALVPTNEQIAQHLQSPSFSSTTTTNTITLPHTHSYCLTVTKQKSLIFIKILITAPHVLLPDINIHTSLYIKMHQNKTHHNKIKTRLCDDVMAG